MTNNQQRLFEYLEQKASFYNNLGFISADPISIPHQYRRKEDIEISGFLAATLAWGQRITIINKGRELMQRMDDSPYDFISAASVKEIESLSTFVHRTFQGIDCIFFIQTLRRIYSTHSGLENIFTTGYSRHQNIKEAIVYFRRVFLDSEHLDRSRKHIADPQSGSAAKRINMFLRWMVRKDNNGVDFGIWNKIKTKDLLCPLDLHSGKIARSLGILSRNYDDWQAVEELTANLCTFDPNDPVKYDFALFGTGINEK